MSGNIPPWDPENSSIAGYSDLHKLIVIWTFLKIGILNEFAYRVNFYVQVFQSAVSLGQALLGVYVVFLHTESLGDWRSYDLLALIGVFVIVGGAISIVIRPSMMQLMTDVRRGTLDYTLTKPEDAQFLISISQFRIWKTTDFVLGGIVLSYALIKRGSAVGAIDAITFGLVLLCGAATIYSFFLVLSTISFWYIKVENILNIFDAMVQAGRWPIGIYPDWLRFVLTFIVPVAFAITVPARSLTGRLDSESLTAAILVAAGMLIASRLFWRWGLRHYSGASA